MHNQTLRASAGERGRKQKYSSGSWNVGESESESVYKRFLVGPSSQKETKIYEKNLKRFLWTVQDLESVPNVGVLPENTVTFLTGTISRNFSAFSADDFCNSTVTGSYFKTRFQSQSLEGISRRCFPARAERTKRDSVLWRVCMKKETTKHYQNSIPRSCQKCRARKTQ